MKVRLKQFAQTWHGWVILSFLFGVLGAWTYGALFAPAEGNASGLVLGVEDQLPSRRVGNTAPGVTPPSFANAAERASESVVFIRTVSSYRQQDDFWSFWDFYGRRRGPISSAGSGVIISKDGYIVTNNHVVDRADEITVTLPNKHSYAAEVIGSDPNTDLALLKIEADGLRPIEVTNSDDLRIGEWVLAIGNPLNLNSTVTAGIVSAKGRNINIVRSQFPIESFIQTDAAINPGNSGGALVNAEGQLVGINTAIKSETGAYSGYGFAIPVNIVNKVVQDFIKFGTIQQAFLGAEVRDIDEQIGSQLATDDYSGVYIKSIASGSAADEAGLQPGDVILEVDGYPVNSEAEYHERIAFHRPGDKLKIMYRRNGRTDEVTAVVTNQEGTTAVLENRTIEVEALGCDLTPLSMIERQKFGVENGWRVSNIRRGPVAQMGLREGFVILKVAGQTPADVDELIDLLLNSRGRVIIDGLNPNGSRVRYQFFSY